MKMCDKVNPDKPKLRKLQRNTFTMRGHWLQGLNDGDLRTITKEFPILINPCFVSLQMVIICCNVGVLSKWCRLQCSTVMEIAKNIVLLLKLVFKSHAPE